MAPGNKFWNHSVRLQLYDNTNSISWTHSDEWQQVSECVCLCVCEREKGLKKMMKMKKNQKWNEAKGNLISISVRRNEKWKKIQNKVNTIHVRIGVWVYKRQRDKWMKDQQTRDSCYRWRKADNRYASSHLHHTIVINVVAATVIATTTITRWKKSNRTMAKMKKK